jgi:8-oxo-dGTP pyrophosphatase MutT (NUDIX family)
VHRRPLLTLLERYASRWPDEALVVQRIEHLVRTRDDCLLRTCWPGHVTASAWILSPDRDSFLLTHHRKLGRWLQLGGHVDGEGRVHLAALREAREESGMQRFTLLSPGLELEPLDVDVHDIPARGSEPAHAHHDVRFLLVADGGEDLVRSDESHDLRWFPLAELDQVAREPSLRRMADKAGTLRFVPVAPDAE